MNLSDLRLRAVALTQPGSFVQLSPDEIMQLVYDLQIHQHELEMQNDELRHVQQELEISRQKYLDLYEHAPIGYFTFNKHGLILEVNLTGADLLRRERSRLIGKPFTAYLAEGTASDFLSYLQRTISTIEPVCQTDLVIRLLVTQELRQVHVESRAVFSDLQGEMVIRSALIDVTANYETKLALNSQQILLQTLVESLPFDVFAIDDSGYYFLQNLTCRQRWADNFIGKKPLEMCAGTDYEAIWLENNRRAFAGETVMGEVAYTFHGKPQFVYNIITPMWVDGQIKGIVGINIDITERVRSEQTLRVSEENFKLSAEKLKDSQTRWQSVVDTLTDGVIVIDGQGVMQSFNSAAEQIFGYGAAEAIGNNVNMLMPEPDHSHHDAYLARYHQTREAKIIGIGREVMGRRKDGSLFYLDLAVSEFEAKGKLMFTGVVRDITARKKAEADLHAAHALLAQAYDETLFGWALALELRDEGTGGHSRRVAELTLRLAQAMNVSEAELVHIWRGALLHDIGKMAIPDAILLKAGPLTAEERLVMQQHPVYAYQMLKPITYLASALDIPHYHHEVWDGSGYPRGLKGQEIPLAARIFSVVDVWDALTSDRPYRAAWPKDKVLKHIYEQAGISFDPQVIEAFMTII